MKVAIIGYSGHAFVAIDIFMSMGYQVFGYCEPSIKNNNPYQLDYLGSETEPTSKLYQSAPGGLFIAIGDNLQRKKSFDVVSGKFKIINAIHASAIISEHVRMGSGNMVSASTVINSQCVLGNGCIINTGAIIEHETNIGDFTHVAPGTVICGNVKIGANCLIGAGSIILPNLTIGEDVVIGAGAVVTKNIESNSTIMGVPAK